MLIPLGAIPLILMLAASTAISTLIITRSRLFVEVRNLFKPTTKIGELIRCPFCTSVWMAWALSLPNTYQSEWGVIIMWWLSVVAIAAPIMAIVNFSTSIITPLVEQEPQHHVHTEPEPNIEDTIDKEHLRYPVGATHD